jgi:hypothetical protein
VGKPPAHVVVVMEENYSYSDIIGNSLAPYINYVAKQSYTANMTLATAITHPSEPNYLDLFSGNNQGVTTDLSGPAPGAPFNDCNIGSSMIQKGYTFIGYSEDQPSVGWISGDQGNYYTKHCPWINWIGHNTNADTIPVTSDVPYSYVKGLYTTGPIFPDSNHYSTLPTMAWVIPNSVDDMHDGSSSTAIPNGDNWFHTNIMPLIRWASKPANNTVVFIIWDEDDYLSTNPSDHIPLLVCSGLIIGGNYNTAVNHYSTLKLWEEMYGITTECSSSATATDYPSNMWTITTGIDPVSGESFNKVTTWPVPAKNELNMNIYSVSADNAKVGLYDMTGRLVKEIPAELKIGDNNMTINTDAISNGIYFLNVVGEKINVCKKIIVSK